MTIYLLVIIRSECQKPIIAFETEESLRNYVKEYYPDAIPNKSRFPDFWKLEDGSRLWWEQAQFKK
jgi:hypothetical protein